MNSDPTKVANLTIARVAAVLTSLICAIPFIIYIWGLDGIKDSSGHLIGRDFINMHFGGLLIRKGELLTLFDQTQYTNAIGAWVGWDYSLHNWSYPPMRYWLAEFYSLLSYPLGLFIWIACGLLALASVARKFGASWFWIFALLFSPAGLFNIWAGQNGFYSAAIIGLALWATVYHINVMAAFLWTVATLKPHLGILVFPLLVTKRRFSVIWIGALFFAALFLITTARYGLDVWGLFLTKTGPQQREVLETWTGLVMHLVPTMFMQGRLLGFDISIAYALHIAFCICVIIFLVRAWPRAKTSFRDLFAWFSLGTFLLLPYMFYYDYLMVQLMLILWTRNPERLFGLQNKDLASLVFAFVWVLPVIAVGISYSYSIQIMPLVILWILFQFQKRSI